MQACAALSRLVSSFSSHVVEHESPPKWRSRSHDAFSLPLKDEVRASFSDKLRTISLEPESLQALGLTIQLLRKVIAAHLPLGVAEKKKVHQLLGSLDTYVTKHEETRSTSQVIDAKVIWPRGLPREREIRTMYPSDETGAPARKMGVDLDWIVSQTKYVQKNEPRQKKEELLKKALAEFATEKEIEVLVSHLSEKSLDTFLEVCRKPARQHLYLLLAQSFMRLGDDNDTYRKVAKKIVIDHLSFTLDMPLEKCVFEDGSDILACVHILKTMIKYKKILPSDVNVYIGKLDAIQAKFKDTHVHLGKRIYFDERTMPFYRASRWQLPINSRYRYGVSQLVEKIQLQELQIVSEESIKQGLDSQQIIRRNTVSLSSVGARPEYTSYLSQTIDGLMRSQQRPPASPHSAIQSKFTASMMSRSSLYPDHFFCCITLTVMIDPVNAADNHTYERSAITDWIEQAKKAGTILLSPWTGLPLASDELVPNIELKQEIDQALKR